MPASLFHLRQSSRADLVPPRRPAPSTSLIRISRPTVALARFLYTTIGGPWGWRSRVGWDDEQWRELLDDYGTETWLSWQYGRPTGYAEMTSDPHGTTAHINYLGLFPGFHGAGLGSQLAWDVARRAWTLHTRWPRLHPATALELTTRSLDSPSALHNYEARGFTVVDRTEIRPDAVMR